MTAITPRTALAAAALLVALPAGPAPLAGQEPGWDGEAEVGANVFFGDRDQSLVNARLEAGHADSTWEISGAGRYTYGRSTDSEGESRLTHRSWNLGGTADHRPFATVSWFGIVGAESSFQREIDLRVHGGAGVKYTLVRSEAALLDASVALLAERTTVEGEPVAEPAGDPADGEPGQTEGLARWSWRLRAKRSIDDDRVVLESTTFYRPVADAFDRYVVESASSVGYGLGDHVRFKVGLVETYDSEAKARGATSNHDGQLLVSLVGSF